MPVRTLELNPRHALLHNLGHMLAARPQDPVIDAAIEQLFETALLQDGLHPDPASMAGRLLMLLEAATGGVAAVAPAWPMRMLMTPRLKRMTRCVIARQKRGRVPGYSSSQAQTIIGSVYS